MNTTPTPTMNTTTTAPDTLAPYYAALTLTTRSYGACYVHAGKRANYTGPDGTIYTVSGYGRSLTTKNGHKYKVHARTPDGKPTPTRDLQDLIRRANTAPTPTA
jgi:hypothetical protein